MTHTEGRVKGRSMDKGPWIPSSTCQAVGSAYPRAREVVVLVYGLGALMSLEQGNAMCYSTRE